jgi:hypothetical protein
MPQNLSDEEIARKLRARGVADHVVAGGALGLIASWRDFVSQVEHGYPLGLDDYRNDLDLRELIAAVGLDSRVASEDQRLRNALVSSPRTIWESSLPDAFWVHGYPRNASGELLADLRAEGLTGEITGESTES